MSRDLSERDEHYYDEHDPYTDQRSRMPPPGGRGTVGPPSWLVKQWREQEEMNKMKRKQEREYYEKKRKLEEEANMARIRSGFENFSNRQRELKAKQDLWFPQGYPQTSSRYLQQDFMY